MYLKKMTKKEQKRYVEMTYARNPELRGLLAGNTWYFKMKPGGIKARNAQGQVMVTCMDNEELKSALESGEFTRVEK